VASRIQWISGQAFSMAAIREFNGWQSLSIVFCKAISPRASTIAAPWSRHHSAIIAEVTEKPASRVILSTLFGGERVVDMLVGEQLPKWVTTDNI
jgi:hydrogenase expression/formation protein HypE